MILLLTRRLNSLLLRFVHFLMANCNLLLRSAGEQNKLFVWFCCVLFAVCCLLFVHFFCCLLCFLLFVLLLFCFVVWCFLLFVFLFFVCFVLFFVCLVLLLVLLFFACAPKSARVRCCFFVVCFLIFDDVESKMPGTLSRSLVIANQHDVLNINDKQDDVLRCINDVGGWRVITFVGDCKQHDVLNVNDKQDDVLRCINDVGGWGGNHVRC